MLESSLRKMQIEKQLFSGIAEIEELKKLISVSKPYFALRSITFTPENRLTAILPIELKNHKEVAGISVAEAGRHVAILGTMAMARVNPRKEKHYYLATDATFERVHANPISDEFCRATINSVNIGKKDGVVTAQLFSKDNILTYNAEIKYAIIHGRIFERLFQGKRKEEEGQNLFNPYMFPAQFEITRQADSSFSAKIDQVRKEDCLGHFANYPALPVARVAGAMIDLSGMHHNKLHNTDKAFCVRKVVMHADAFIFADEKVEFVTEVATDTESGELIIESFAKAEAECKAVEMKCWFY